MAGIGPITNTRTVDDALVEAMGRLTTAPQTARILELVSRARGYQAIMGGWEIDEPEAEEQFEIIGEVMRLMSNIISVVEAEKRAAREAAAIQEVVTPGAEWVAGPDEPETLTLGTDLPGMSSPPTAVSARGGSGRPPAPPGFIALYEELWQPITFLNGVRMRVIHRDSVTDACIVQVRLDAEAALPSHHHGVTEHVYVLDGAIRYGGAALHAGGCLRFEAGEASEAVSAMCEATVLLINSDRAFVL